MESVLVGVDDESASQSAIDWVIERARRRAIKVKLVAVLDAPLADPDVAESRLQAARLRVESSAPGVVVETAVLGPLVIDALVAQAREADLLVIGCHPDHPVRSALAGSLPARITARARPPVVLVPDGWTPSPGPIVVGIGDDDTANRALLFAAHEATEIGYELSVVHAWRGLDASDPTVNLVVDPVAMRNLHRGVVDAALARARAAFPAVKVRGVLMNGPRAQSIAEYAADASLVVLGTHGHGAVVATLLGSTVNAVRRRTSAPLCVVPPRVVEMVASPAAPESRVVA